MTTTAHDITYRLEQKRRVQADFPGPKSVALTERRKAVVAAGVASSVPSTSPTPTAASSTTSTATPSSTSAPASP